MAFLRSTKDKGGRQAFDADAGFGVSYCTPSSVRFTIYRCIYVLSALKRA